MAKTMQFMVSEQEIEELFSMSEYLETRLEEMEMAPAGTYTWEQIEKVQDRLAIVKVLMGFADRPGALVCWPTLKKIRQIATEREAIRYNRCLTAGMPEGRAALAFK